jgi:hypothetical protein
MSVPPLQRWVRDHKGDLLRLGIRPWQVRGGGFEFMLSYIGTPPYHGRRWAGMLDSVTVMPAPDGRFTAQGRRVVSDKAAGLAHTGILFGDDFAALLEGDRLVRLLGRFKLCGGGSDPGGPALPPAGKSVRFDVISSLAMDSPIPPGAPTMPEAIFVCNMPGPADCPGLARGLETGLTAGTVPEVRVPLDPAWRRVGRNLVGPPYGEHADPSDVGIYEAADDF